MARGRRPARALRPAVARRGGRGPAQDGGGRAHSRGGAHPGRVQRIARSARQGPGPVRDRACAEGSAGGIPPRPQRRDPRADGTPPVHVRGVADSATIAVGNSLLVPGCARAQAPTSNSIKYQVTPSGTSLALTHPSPLVADTEFSNSR